MFGVSACVSLLLHHKVQKFYSGTGSPRWSQKKVIKRLWCRLACFNKKGYLLEDSETMCWGFTRAPVGDLVTVPCAWAVEASDTVGCYMTLWINNCWFSVEKWKCGTTFYTNTATLSASGPDYISSLMNIVMKYNLRNLYSETTKWQCGPSLAFRAVVTLSVCLIVNNVFPRIEAGPRIQAGGLTCDNRGQALNISWGSWFTYWSSLAGMHCLRVISVRHGTIWS